MATDETRERIIDAGERLFAAGGEDATSLRAITREADVNVAAIHYHFGDRDGLIEAILDRRLQPLNERRLELLDALLAEQSEPSVRDLLVAFARPDLEVIDEMRHTGRAELARVMGRAYTLPSPKVGSMMQRQFAPIARAFMPRFATALPHLDGHELRARIDLVVAIITLQFARATDPGQPGPMGVDGVDAHLDRLVAFLAPGLEAPAARPVEVEPTGRNIP